MKIESTHATDSTVRVVTINGVVPDKDAVGIEEELRVRKTPKGDLLAYKAKHIVLDGEKRAMIRVPAFISSNSGEKIKIPASGIPIISVGDCYSVDVDGKRRYIGDGAGSFGLAAELGGE